MVSCMDIKRGVLFLLVMFLFSISFVIISAAPAAQEDSGFFDEDAVLDETEGITPDNPLYFIDNFFDNFADVVKVRQEKVAEIRAMIEAGKYEEALEALEKYKRYAEELEREVSPEQRDEARRSAAAIYNVLKSLESQIPEEYKDDFDGVIEQEEAIVTAAEIANRIKELCETLSELDPLQYSRICRTNEESPQWHQRLDRDLTEAQRQEAEEFFEIMSECFETAGAQCRCEDITITPFAEKCSLIAPLAYACDVEGDEVACDRMDEIEDEEPIEDLLPDYLQDVLRAIEDRFEDSQFDNHAPRECREAGATTREACMRIMITENSPPECVEALLEANVQNEREGREICESIMFELEAPFECIDAGLTDFRECGKFMFQLHAPQVCLDAGLTGEHRSDERKCREIAGDAFGGPRGPGPGGPGPGFIDFNCREITDSDERLACFDRAVSQTDSQHGGFDDENYDGPCMTGNDWDVKKQECRNLYGEHAGDEPIYGDSGEGYECVVDITCIDFGEYKRVVEGDNPWEGCEVIYCGQNAYCEYGTCIPFEGGGQDCESQCPGASRTDWVNDQCACFYEDEEKVEATPTCDNVDCGDTAHCEEGQCVPNEYAPGEGPGEPTTTEEPATTETTPGTGEIIAGDNDFLEYYFG